MENRIGIWRTCWEGRKCSTYLWLKNDANLTEEQLAKKNALLSQKGNYWIEAAGGGLGKGLDLTQRELRILRDLVQRIFAQLEKFRTLCGNKPRLHP